VYFYRFNNDNIPELFNTMNNYMGCSSIMFNQTNKLCLSFKLNEPNLIVLKRKYDHGFHETIDNTSREGNCGQNIVSKDCFLVSDDNFVEIHCAKSLRVINKIIIPMDISNTRDMIEILTIVVSKDESMLAVLTGKNLIKEIEELHQIFIYKIEPDLSFELLFKKNLPEDYRFFSKTFDFCEKHHENSLYLVSHSRLVNYNFKEDKFEDVYVFKNTLES